MQGGVLNHTCGRDSDGDEVHLEGIQAGYLSDLFILSLDSEVLQVLISCENFHGPNSIVLGQAAKFSLVLRKLYVVSKCIAQVRATKILPVINMLLVECLSCVFLDGTRVIERLKPPAS